MGAPIKITEKKHESTHDVTSIIMDEPELNNVVLDFPNYAETLAQLIINSEAKFTVGIFGEWGTGKSTLMLNVKKILTKNNRHCVEFNPWRYERDESLSVIPLILTIIEYLTVILEKQDSTILNESTFKPEENFGQKIKRIFKGLSLNVKFGIPYLGEVEATYDFSKTLLVEEETPEPKNFSKTTIQEGLELIEELMNKIKYAQESKLKLTIFIDDLDRCTPVKAIEILESIKVLFDIGGVVFVLALNKEITETAIDEKYGNLKGKFSGNDYLKKIIQLQVTIPSWSSEDIQGYLNSIIQKHKDDYYKQIFTKNIPLIVAVVERNPREVKRLLNSFILANQIFKFQTPEEHQELLTIQALLFRWDWLREIIFDKSIMKKVNRIILLKKPMVNKLPKNSIEKKIMNDVVLSTFLKREGKMIFEINDEKLRKYRRAISTSSQTLERRTNLLISSSKDYEDFVQSLLTGKIYRSFGSISKNFSSPIGLTIPDVKPRTWTEVLKES